MKDTLKEIGLLLVLLAILIYPIAQCSYDNWVKWQVAKAAKKVADK